MTVSLIVNTCALGTPAALNSAKTTPHVDRAYALRNWILPAYAAASEFDQVIVVGEWEPGDGYTYIPSPSAWENCIDALMQRQLGFEAATGDWIVCQHDDHMLDLAGLNEIAWSDPTLPGVLVPERWTRLRNPAGELLPNGETVYISGHCAIYRRDVLERCSWSAVPRVHTWDLQHTRQIREAGFQISWSNVLRVWDIELGGMPWR
jgi:hypothetical protein